MLKRGLLRYIAGIACFFAFGGLAFSADKTVILVSQDKESFDKLSKDDKNFASSAYQQFLVGLSKDSEISIRTESTTDELRKIQRDSQKELEKGMASDAYEIDKRTLAKLSITFDFSKLSGSYQITANISDIEKNESFMVNSPKFEYAAGAAKDEIVDKLTYDALIGLTTRKYISSLSPDVASQLLHEENSTESFEKYIADYSRQLADLDKELSELQGSKADKLAREDAERAIQLRKEMIERNKMIAEENLRKRQTEDAAMAKRQKELDSMQEEQRATFTSKVEELNKKKREIQAAERNNLSLKKRIELIEQGKKNLKELNEALNESIAQSNASLSEREEEEVKAKEQEDYDLGDKTADGTPTKVALKVRQVEIDKIRRKYADMRKENEKKMRDSSRDSIKEYESQINTNISELQRTTYGFRSIDNSQDYLRLEVDEFDGEKYSWTVHSALEVNDIPKFEIEFSKLPDYEITYKMMTGNEPPSDAEFEKIEKMKDDSKKDARMEEFLNARNEYKTILSNTNLYFRTSVPYLYSEVLMKVAYNELSDRYVATLISFAIYKTEDNAKALFSRNEKDFRGDRAKEEKRLRDEAKEAEKRRKADEEQRRLALIKDEQKRLEAEREAERERQREEEEILRQEKEEERRRAREIRYNSQKSRRGLVLDMGGINSKSFAGVDSSIQILFGGRHIFMGGGIDIMGLELKDGYYMDVSSPYSYRTGFGGLNGFGCIGYSATLGKFAPFVGLGIGGYNFFVWRDTDSSTSSSSSSTETKEAATASLKGGFFFQSFAGFDIRLNKGTTVGFTYKLKYFGNVGFADSYNLGVTFGPYF